MFFSSHTMRSSVNCFFFLLLLLLSGPCFFSDDIGFSSHLGYSSPVPDEEGQAPRDVNSPFFSRKLKYHEPEMIAEEEKGATAIASTVKPESFGRGGARDLDDLVFHTDYHGVTTHPTPSPKHPKP